MMKLEYRQIVTGEPGFVFEDAEGHEHMDDVARKVTAAFAELEARLIEKDEAINVRANRIVDLEQELDDSGQQIAALETRLQTAQECLSVIVDWIDVHSHQHFVDFTNDSPEMVKWRTATDLALAGGDSQ